MGDKSRITLEQIENHFDFENEAVIHHQSNEERQETPKKKPRAQHFTPHFFEI